MPNLEQLIIAWRKDLAAARQLSADTLDELERHLRDSVDQFVRSGLTEAEAFQRAAAQLGNTRLLASEFQKLEQRTWLPVKVVSGLGILMTIAFLTFFLRSMATGQRELLLASHVLLVMLGYTSTFLVGAMGICYVGQRCFSEITPLQQRALPRFTFLLGGVAAGLTLPAIILGMVWAKMEWGRYWAWDIKETSALCILLWQVSFLLAHKLGRVGIRGIFVMSVLGNVVVSLGWFGANLLYIGLHNYGSRTGWVLLAVVLAHFAFFLIGWAPAGWLRARQAS